MSVTSDMISTSLVVGECWWCCCCCCWNRLFFFRRMTEMGSADQKFLSFEQQHFWVWFSRVMTISNWMGILRFTYLSNIQGGDFSSNNQVNLSLASFCLPAWLLFRAIWGLSPPFSTKLLNSMVMMEFHHAYRVNRMNSWYLQINVAGGIHLTTRHHNGQSGCCIHCWRLTIRYI